MDGHFVQGRWAGLTLIELLAAVSIPTSILVPADPGNKYVDVSVGSPERPGCTPMVKELTLKIRTGGIPIHPR